MERRSLLLGGLALTTPLLTFGPSGAAPAAGTAQSTAPESGRLTNLAHLDFLRQGIAPPSQYGHTTYRLADTPEIGVLWTYAEPGPDGDFRRVGGGTYDPETDTWGQGAYNADDISRAAVVYLRHWRQTGATTSRDAGYQLLRGLTYLQTADGSQAGNVVLWMQPDGTLNPSAEPKESPDPSDSGVSYWLARTIWALGEGYAAFRHTDSDFAGFLSNRLDLAITAVQRQVLVRYKQWQIIDGERTPAWLIVDGADATAEAVLGLAAYVEADGGPTARQALHQLTEGIAALADGDVREWPFGAIRPWALSRSVWHGWGGQMPAALARAAQALDDRTLLSPAITDSAVFTPWLLTSGGPDNGRLPTRTDRTQIAYGVDSRVQSLLAVADVSGRFGFAQLAAVTAAWFFGANPAGTPGYDPETGRAIDGINGDGHVNRNSGAESTIHTLLSMLALDTRPGIAALAHRSEIVKRVGAVTLEAEDATRSGGAAVVNPPSAWTGESLISGAYVDLPAGAGLRWQLPPTDQPRLVLPVVHLRPGVPARTVWRSDAGPLGEVDHARVGAQGNSPAPGALLPVTLPRDLPASAAELTAVATAGEPATLDAVVLEPLISRLELAGDGRSTTLLHSAARTVRTAQVSPGGTAATTVEAYDAAGVLRSRHTGTTATLHVTVLPGGFTLVRQ